MDEIELSVHKWLSQFPADVPVIVVPVFNAYEDFMECLGSLMAGTPSDVPILVIDDASTDERIFVTLNQLSRNGRFLYVRKLANTGFVDTVNLAFKWSRPRDVVVINSDVIVPRQWLERLKAAAYCMSTVATATPLTNSGTIVSVPYRNRPIGHMVGGESVEEVDARIRANSLRLYPIIPTAVGHCVYFRRSALDVVGYFDPVFSPGYGEEVDFSQRAVMAGFHHVLADDLFVYHKGSRSFNEERARLREAHERIVRKRYPWYRDWTTQAANETRTSLSFAIERAQSALLGYHIAIDATKMGGPLTGTQVHTLELIKALVKIPGLKAHLSMIVPDHIRESDLPEEIKEAVYKIYHLSDFRGVDRPYFHLIHRNFQLQSSSELAFLRRIAERVIISQLDFIAFSNPAYLNSPGEWTDYRETTRMAFNIVDGIIFLTRHVLEEASHWGLHIDPDRTQVIPPGTNHLLPLSSLDASPGRLPDPPYILMLGTSFLHKNRLYALKVFKILKVTYGWRGKLVFAGPTPSAGGSESLEMAFLRDNPDLQPLVCYLGPVAEEEKVWLLKNASLVLYPSTREGFGLVPFEAASVGTPALTARISALTEVLGDEVIYLENFDPEEGAAVVWSFLSDPEIRAYQVQALQKRMATFTWEEAAARTWDFYQHILNLPPRFSSALPYLFTQSARHPVIVSPPHTPLLKRAVWRVAQTIYACTNEWKQLFIEARQYLRFLWAQRLTKSREEDGQ